MPAIIAIFVTRCTTCCCCAVTMLPHPFCVHWQADEWLASNGFCCGPVQKHARNPVSRVHSRLTVCLRLCTIDGSRRAGQRQRPAGFRQRVCLAGVMTPFEQVCLALALVVCKKWFAHVCLLALVPCAQHVQHTSARRCTSLSKCTPYRLCDGMTVFLPAMRFSEAAGFVRCVQLRRVRVRACCERRALSLPRAAR